MSWATAIELQDQLRPPLPLLSLAGPSATWQKVEGRAQCLPSPWPCCRLHYATYHRQETGQYTEDPFRKRQCGETQHFFTITWRLYIYNLILSFFSESLRYWERSLKSSVNIYGPSPRLSLARRIGGGGAKTKTMTYPLWHWSSFPVPFPRSASLHSINNSSE